MSCGPRRVVASQLVLHTLGPGKEGALKGKVWCQWLGLGGVGGGEDRHIRQTFLEAC